MKRFLIFTFIILISFPGFSRKKDSVKFSNEYLDTVKIDKAKALNNYFMVGFNYGVSLSQMNYQPEKHGRFYRFSPQYASLMFTHYEKMFDYIPYFGFSFGAAYGHEGFTWKPDEEGYVVVVDGASDCDITVVEIPALAQIHIDAVNFKMMINAGIYGGYRLSISRSGPGLDPQFATKFHDYENRWDYGLQGGVGFGYMFDPIELHIGALVRYSWSSLYQPNSYQTEPAKSYMFRYAYPFDIMITAGIHFQLTKRSGKTTRAIKKEAKSIVFDSNKYGNNQSQNWK